VSVKKSEAFFSKGNELRQISLRWGQEASKDFLWLQRWPMKVCVQAEVGLRFQGPRSRSWNIKLWWVFFKTNFKPPWMRSVPIPDVRNKGCSIPYPSGDYLEAVLSSLRKWMNPDCECCLGSLAVTLIASINLTEEIASDEVSTKTWCHIYKTFLNILEESGGRLARISLKSRPSFKIRSKYMI
jgi:hypothetical protein